ncbi:MAG: energy-coupling factor transporter transmembrane component T family protein [Anaerolineaceae bacterium]
MSDNNQTETRPKKEYVRTFLFSMRLGAPLSKLHVITKFLGIVILSFITIRVMDEKNPDPILAGTLFILALITLNLGGVSHWLFRSYLVIIFPMFLFLFITWVAFTPDLGSKTFITLPIYSGEIRLGISLALIAFFLSMGIYYLITIKIAYGIFIGIAVAIFVAKVTPNPGIIFRTIPLFGPYSFILSDVNLLIAGTKVLGYAAMVFMTLMLVMTTRDSEFTAALRQLKMPYMGRFFLSIVLRTLSMSLMDFETIRQAQIARGIRVKKMNIFGLLRNVAMMSVPLVATMLRRSSEIGDALLARGFSLKRTGKEFLEIQKFKIADYVVLIILALLSYLILVQQVNLYKTIY